MGGFGGFCFVFLFVFFVLFGFLEEGGGGGAWNVKCIPVYFQDVAWPCMHTSKQPCFTPYFSELIRTIYFCSSLWAFTADKTI